MKNSCYRLVVVLLVLFSIAMIAPMPVSGQVREWADQSGKYKIEAEFKGVKDNKVILQRLSNGKRMTIPFAKLCDADQAYVKTLLEAEKSPETANSAPPKTEPANVTPPAVKPEPAAVTPPPKKNEPKTEPMKTESPVVEKQPEPAPAPKKIEPAIAPKKIEPAPKKTQPIQPRPTTPPKPVTPPIQFAASDLEMPELGPIDQSQLQQLPAPFNDIAVSINADENVSVVRKSLASLSDLPSNQTNPSLINLLKKSTNHSDESCRRNAVEQLNRLSPSTMLPFIARSISDPSGRIRRQAFEIIENSKDPRYIPAMIKRFPNLIDRARIFTILTQFGSQAEFAVHPLLKHENTKVRQEAARLLGIIGTSASTSALQATDSDESGILKLIAKKAMKEINKRGQ